MWRPPPSSSGQRQRLEAGKAKATVNGEVNLGRSAVRARIRVGVDETTAMKVSGHKTRSMATTIRTLAIARNADRSGHAAPSWTTYTELPTVVPLSFLMSVGVCSQLDVFVSHTYRLQPRVLFLGRYDPAGALRSE